MNIDSLDLLKVLIIKSKKIHTHLPKFCSIYIAKFARRAAAKNPEWVLSHLAGYFYYARYSVKIIIPYNFGQIIRYNYIFYILIY